MKALLFVVIFCAVLEIFVQRAEYKNRKAKQEQQKERERIKEEIREWRMLYNRPHPKYERR